VPSEKQIAANQHNARKSTGPRSIAGKKRASRNANVHGLSGAAFTKQVEKLARKITGRTKDQIVLEYARLAAEAELELGRVRRVRLALIERASALGSLEAPKYFPTIKKELRWLIAMGVSIANNRDVRPPMPILQDPSATMPTQEPHRGSEAVRRILPDLIKLDRYESRAVSRRDKAIRAKLLKDALINDTILSRLPVVSLNEPNINE
jgi:hypothetical protein